MWLRPPRSRQRPKLGTRERVTGEDRGLIQCDFYWVFPRAQLSRCQTEQPEQPESFLRICASCSLAVSLSPYLPPPTLYFSSHLNPNSAALFPSLCLRFDAIHHSLALSELHWQKCMSRKKPRRCEKDRLRGPNLGAPFLGTPLSVQC